MTLAEIIERLEKTTSSDRELDTALEVMAWPDLAQWPRSEFGGWIHPELGLIAPASDYTDSIDAAVALCERVLPGWTIARLSQDDHKFWHAELRRGYLTSYDKVVFGPDGGKGKPPALALCLAILRARRGTGDER